MSTQFWFYYLLLVVYRNQQSSSTDMSTGTTPLTPPPNTASPDVYPDGDYNSFGTRYQFWLFLYSVTKVKSMIAGALGEGFFGGAGAVKKLYFFFFNCYDTNIFSMQSQWEILIFILLSWIKLKSRLGLKMTDSMKLCTTTLHIRNITKIIYQYRSILIGVQDSAVPVLPRERR